MSGKLEWERCNDPDPYGNLYRVKIDQWELCVYDGGRIDIFGPANYTANLSGLEIQHKDRVVYLQNLAVEIYTAMRKWC